MIWAQVVKSISKVAIAALVLSAVATGGKAQQSIYQGKFTLPVETHWGSATLPAGEYTFTVGSAAAQYRLYIHGERSNFIIPTVTAENSAPQNAQLNLVDVADKQTVETFDAPQLGLTFSYWTPKQKHMPSNVAHQKATPQATPETQATENRTSVAVYSAGR